jgi:hypothetical protein
MSQSCARPQLHVANRTLAGPAEPGGQGLHSRPEFLFADRSPHT